MKHRSYWKVFTILSWSICLLNRCVIFKTWTFEYSLKYFPSIICTTSPEGSHPIIGTGVLIFQIKIQESYSYSLLRLSCYCPGTQSVVSVVVWIIRTCEFSSLFWNQVIVISLITFFRIIEDTNKTFLKTAAL